MTMITRYFRWKTALGLVAVLGSAAGAQSTAATSKQVLADFAIRAVIEQRVDEGLDTHRRRCHRT